jgi:hypothetical protein
MDPGGAGWGGARNGGDGSDALPILKVTPLKSITLR